MAKPMRKHGENKIEAGLGPKLANAGCSLSEYHHPSARGCARKIHRVIDVSAALIAGNFGIGTEWSGTIDFARCMMRCDNFRWRFSVLDPLFDKADLVEGVRALSAGAMSHAGNHKQPHPLRRACGIATRIENRLVEVDC